MKVVSRTKVYAAPEKGMSAYETSYYVKREGVEKVRMRLLDISDDVPGPREVAFSNDNGRTWEPGPPVPQPRPVEGGMLREWPCEFFVDPVNGLQLQLLLVGIFPTPSSLHGMYTYGLHYRVFKDGGRTPIVDEPLVQRGYTPEHPMAGMFIGHNAFTNAAPNSIVRLSDGRVLAMICKTVLGPGGKLYNPPQGFGWVEIQVLHGFWRDDARIEWHAGPIIALPPTIATRGICEPTMTQTADGNIHVVMRACNGGRTDPESKLPCHKWHSVSRDGGATWSFPEPWQYDDGTAFHSPDSISQLLRLRDGRLFWLGNITAKNPVHGMGREKLYIGRVDESSFRLVRDSLFLIAEPNPGDPPTQLSNFLAHEDRESGELVLHLPWFVMQEKDKWGADSWVYRLRLG